VPPPSEGPEATASAKKKKKQQQKAAAGWPAGDTEGYGWAFFQGRWHPSPQKGQGVGSGHPPPGPQKKPGYGGGVEATGGDEGGEGEEWASPAPRNPTCGAVVEQNEKMTTQVIEQCEVF